MLKVYGASFAEKMLLKKVEKAVFSVLGQRDFFVTEVQITDEDVIRELNSSFRNTDKVTDVLSFPSFDGLKPPVDEGEFCDTDRCGGRVMLGNIAVCRARALEQAEEYGHSYKRELGFLLAHGLLHLFGFDHVEEDGEKVMKEKQKAVMEAVGLKRQK